MITLCTLIIGLGQNGLAHRNEVDIQSIRGALKDVLAAPPRQWRQVMLSTRQDFQPVIIAADTDDLLHALIVGGELLVGERPIVLDAGKRPLAEIRRRVSKGDGV